MTNRPDTTTTARHSRLFELIRQENLANERGITDSHKPSIGLAEMQLLLKQAHQSLSPGKEL